MIGRILNKFGVISLLKKRRQTHLIKAERAREEHLVVDHLSPDKFEALTKEEKKQIEDTWGGIGHLSDIRFREFEMFKHIYGFDARFLTHSHYLPVIARLLNDFQYTRIFDDKGLLGFLKSKYIRIPKSLVRHIVSDFYDNDMRQISLDEAVEICSQQEELFIKPSKDTSGGKGARLIKLKSLSLEDRSRIIKEELAGRNNDYVVQECIHQHPVMAQFNNSSVNTLRITTLMLNGKFSVCSIILRCGKDGSNVDNWGVGGLLVDVSIEGKLNSTAYDIYLNEYHNNGDCKFAESSIPQLPVILDKIEKAHREDFAICKFIGWDIAIDQNGDPVIIELNSSQPGVIGEQLVSGPIFGNRTQEVIEYCKSKRFSY